MFDPAWQWALLRNPREGLYGSARDRQHGQPVRGGASHLPRPNESHLNHPGDAASHRRRRSGQFTFTQILHFYFLLQPSVLSIQHYIDFLPLKALSVYYNKNGHSNDLHCEMADVWPRNEDVFLSEIIRLPSLL